MLHFRAAPPSSSPVQPRPIAKESLCAIRPGCSAHGRRVTRRREASGQLFRSALGSGQISVDLSMSIQSRLELRSPYGFPSGRYPAAVTQTYYLSQTFAGAHPQTKQSRISILKVAARLRDIMAVLEFTDSTSAIRYVRNAEQCPQVASWRTSRTRDGMNQRVGTANLASGIRRPGSFTADRKRAANSRSMRHLSRRAAAGLEASQDLGSPVAPVDLADRGR
jgi:hypothetical protein